jgi:hypothetical protein
LHGLATIDGLALYYTMACRAPDVHVLWEDLNLRVFSRECMVVIEGYPSLFKGPSYHCPLPKECKQEPVSPKRARCPSELAKLWFFNEDLTQIKKMYVYDNTVLMFYFHHHPNMLLLGSLQYYAF